MTSERVELLQGTLDLIVLRPIDYGAAACLRTRRPPSAGGGRSISAESGESPSSASSKLSGLVNKLIVGAS
jgi:hypothetical protein